MLVCFLVVFSPICPEVLAGSEETTTILQEIAQKGFDAKEAVDKPEDVLYKQIGNFILVLIRIVGVVLMIVILYAGFLWLTAGGNQEQVSQAMKWIKNGIIGVVIVAMAYLIVGFVVGSLFSSEIY